jgi:hypothetical protein
VDASEVEKGGGGKHGIAFAYCWRHQGNDHCEGSGGGGNRQWNQNAAVTPMEEMALAQALGCAGAQRGASVEQAISYIDGPGDQSE